MNLGALLALLKLVQDTGLTKTKPTPRKIYIDVVPLTYEQYKDIPTGEKKLGRPGLRPKGL
jgi:hypothetical protein